ncbi:MAG TPA: hypothetical protein VGG90_00170 [Candidatus Dormibacteraeota bacterium]|jgi:hypothetical protein
MKWAGLALIALLGACAAPGVPEARGQSPAVVDSPTPSPSMVPATMPISQVAFSCRLPVYVWAESHQGEAMGDVIEFPAGTVTPDPASVSMRLLYRPGAELYDYSGFPFFDRAYLRWLPVTRNAVSPDGAYYAYTDRALLTPSTTAQGLRATIHVVAVETGVDLAFDGGDWSAPYVVLDYSAEGIYLITTAGVYAGLWLMDPTTGSVTRIANLSNVQGNAGGNFFWVGTANPSDPNPMVGIAPDQLDRLNLVDGSRVAWFYRPGSSVLLVGQDVSGHAIILVSGVDGSTELFLLLGPQSSRSILKFGSGATDLAFPIADQHGVWFGSPHGIYLYSDAGGLQKVSSQPGYPANGCI